MKPIAKTVKVKLDLVQAFDRVQADLDSVQDFFDGMQDTGLRNLNFYIGNQWTEEEISAHHEQNREPMVFNEILPKVEHLVGSQMKTKMDSKAVGREPSDEAGAQLLTYLLKWAEQLNDLPDLETTVFRNGIIAGYAAAAVYWDTSDIPYGFPKIDYIPFGELRWDKRAVKYDLSDARWLCRSALLSRIELAEMFPEYQNYIFSMNETPEVYRNEYQNLVERRLYATGYSTQNQDRELIQYREHYERIKVHQYIVVDDIRNEVMRFDDKKDATDYYEELLATYTKGGIETSYEDSLNTDKVLLLTASTNKLIQTIIIGDKAVSRDILDIPDFPYIIYFAYMVEGVFFGVVDAFIDPQIEVNRSWSQWDFALGTQNKGMKTVVESLLKRGWSIEDVRAEASKTHVMIPVMSHAAFNNVPDAPINPQIFDTISFAINRMTDYAGGRNVLGFSENAAESGKAVNARAEAGGVARLTLFDNLRKWRMKVAERIVWYLKHYMSPQQIVRLIGNQEDIFYVNLDKDVLDTLREIKTDIIVSEAINTDTVNERYFTQLVNFFQVTQVPPEISMPMLLEYSSLPSTKKEELKQYFELYKAYMQQQMQQAEEAKLQKQVEGQVKRKKMRDELMVADEEQAMQESMMTGGGMQEAAAQNNMAQMLTQMAQ